MPDKRLGAEWTRQHVESLWLKSALGVLDNTLDTARIKQMNHRQILEQLLCAELRSAVSATSLGS